jgi:hypothetical protein
MKKFDPKLIDGQICFPCENQCGKYLPYNQERICHSCKKIQETYSISNPGFWHPEGYLYEIHLKFLEQEK